MPISGGVSGGGGGGGSTTQYVDSVTTPTNPTGMAIVFDNSGTEVDVGVDHPFPTSGTFTVPAPTTSTPTSVNASVTSVQLLAANTSAKSRSITNNGAANLYLGFGTTPTTALWKYKLVPNAVWESPLVLFTGIINGIWDSVSGNAQISEEV